MFIRPIKRFVLLLDDQPEADEKGVVVRRRFGTYHHDFVVVAIGRDERADFDVGDVVVLDDPNKGRRVMLDGTVYRFVRVSDIVAVAEAGS